MAKPDDRSNNPERIEDNIWDTKKRMDETQNYVNEHGQEISEQQKQQFKEKNQRREESIDGLRNELQDEVEDQQRNQ